VHSDQSPLIGAARPAGSFRVELVPVADRDPFIRVESLVILRIDLGIPRPRQPNAPISITAPQLAPPQHNRNQQPIQPIGNLNCNIYFDLPNPLSLAIPINRDAFRLLLLCLSNPRFQRNFVLSKVEWISDHILFFVSFMPFVVKIFFSARGNKRSFDPWLLIKLLLSEQM
jgi:hypothetical protein